MKILLTLILWIASNSCFGEAVSNDSIADLSPATTAPAPGSSKDDDKYADRAGECQDIAAGSCMQSPDRFSCLTIVQTTPHLHGVYRSCMGIMGSRPATKQELLKKMVERYPDYKPYLSSMIKSDT